MTHQKSASYLTILSLLIPQTLDAFLVPPVVQTYSSFLHPQHDRNHHQRNRVTQQSFRKRHNQNTFLFMSSIGDGKGGEGGSGGNSSGNNNLDDWLDPRKSSSESDNLKRARAQMSEESLPINFDESLEETEETESENEVVDNVDDDNDDDDDTNVQSLINQKNELTGKIELLKGENFKKSPEEIISSNPYLQVVSKLSPSDLISKFTSTAHPRVQDAVRSTVLGLIGTLPKMAFETTTITTGERLASLMFQLQLTGYMLKNADYRLSLSQSLGGMQTTNSNGQRQYLLEGDLDDSEDDYDYDEEDEEGRLSEGKVRGKIKITYGKPNDEETSSDTKSGEKDNDAEDGEGDDNSAPSMEIEVDAAAYMAELRSEVAKLREDLVTTRKEKEDEIRKDLLLYIRTLPQKELKSLTSTLSDDVLNAMKGLVNVVMAGIGEGQIGPETVTEQSGEAMAQLCMWQLVVGYNLRELEVREEMKNALRSGSLDYGSNTEKDDETDDDQESSIDFEEGGFE